MRRYHQEKHIIDNRVRAFKQLANWRSPPRGKFRKSFRCAGCGKSRCQLCHPEKYPKRIPTRQEIQAKKELDGTDT